jgi:hypothetical protein
MAVLKLRRFFQLTLPAELRQQTLPWMRRSLSAHAARLGMCGRRACRHARLGALVLCRSEEF